MAGSQTIRDIGEFGLIDRIAAVVGPAWDGVAVGIGDDTAVVDTGGPEFLLATIDMQVEGRHFLRERSEPAALGRRIAAVNLSDIAAMGGRPRWALASLALPPALPVAWVEQLYRGMRDELGRFGATVIGGNLSGGEAIVLDLALLGEVERGRVLRRAGARPGDAILVTGSLGASAAGRHALDARLIAGESEVSFVVAAHQCPAARVAEGRAIADTGLATAMIDLSDGLSSDLGHILDASHVGAEVDLASLPIAPETRHVAARLGLDPLRLAVGGGEDYELLLTAPPSAIPSLRTAVSDATGLPLTPIGRILPAAEGRWLTHGPTRRPMSAEGWDHFVN